MDDLTHENAALRAEVASLRARLAQLHANSEPAPEDPGAPGRDTPAGAEVSSDVFWLEDWTTRKVVYVSPSYEWVWGEPRQALYDDPRAWMARIHDEDRDHVLQCFIDHAEAGRYDVEFRLRHPDGTTRWIHDRAFPIHDAEGRVVRIAGLSEDITERRTALQLLDRRQRAIIRLANDPAITSGDIDAAARRLCQAACEHVAVDRAKLWALSESGDTMECIACFSCSGGGFQDGGPMTVGDAPRFLEALAEERVLDIADASVDGRVDELRECLARDGVSSAMYAGIRVSGKAIGVIGFETESAPRAWRAEELSFASEIAEQASHAYQNHVRHKSDDRMREIQARLVEAQRIARVGSWVWSIPTDELWWSEQHYRLLGEDPDEYVPTYDKYMERVHVEDRQGLIDAVWKTIRQDVPFKLEYRQFRSDGELLHIQAMGTVQRDADGNALVMSGTCQDITERKLIENRQRLMVRELDHRVKNTLASVLAIARQTRDSSTDLESFYSALEGRIASLAQVHEALARRRWDGASLTDLVRNNLAPHGPEGKLWHVEGEDLILPYRCVGPLSMALHELATNASKYGALSKRGGVVHVYWRMDRRAKPRLKLHWCESGGPPVTRPTRPGFGTTLIEQGLAYELGGDVQLVFAPEGVSCQIEIELES